VRGLGSRRRTFLTLLGIVMAMLAVGLSVPFLFGDDMRDAVRAGAAAGPGVTAAGDSPAAATSGAAADASGGPLTGATAGPAAGVRGGAGISTRTGPSGGAGGPSVLRGLRATDRGVTATTVRMGFPLLDVGNLGKVGISVGVSPQQEQEAFQAFVDHINAHGGMAGRKIEPYYVSYDVVSETDQQAACLSLTQDSKVFGVVLGFNYESANECVAVSNETPLLGTATNNPDEFYGRAAGRLFTMYPRGSRMMADFAATLGRMGALSGREVGILDDAGGDPSGSASAALEAAVKRAGGRARTAQLSGDLGVGSSQIPVAVNQMQTAGVSVVLLMANTAFSTQFVQQASSQGWTPAYYVSDWLAMHNDTGSQNMPQTYDGTIGVVSERVNEQHANVAPNGAAVECRKIWEQQTHQTAPAQGIAAYGSIMQSCTALLTFTAAANAAGPDLTRTAWSAAMQRIGSFEATQWGPGSFRPGKFDFPDQYRLEKWYYSCKCWKPAGPFAPPPG
jgi:ABC-type branched-subunit amino acid transport system substrate-binding protein